MSRTHEASAGGGPASLLTSLPPPEENMEESELSSREHPVQEGHFRFGTATKIAGLMVAVSLCCVSFGIASGGINRSSIGTTAGAIGHPSRISKISAVDAASKLYQVDGYTWVVGTWSNWAGCKCGSVLRMPSGMKILTETGAGAATGGIGTASALSETGPGAVIVGIAGAAIGAGAGAATSFAQSHCHECAESPESVQKHFKDHCQCG